MPQMSCLQCATEMWNEAFKMLLWKKYREYLVLKNPTKRYLEGKYNVRKLFQLTICETERGNILADNPIYW